MYDTTRFRRYLRCSVWGLMLLAALALGIAAGQDPNIGYRTHSRVWLPYGPDARTLGLFHLDAARPGDVGKLERTLLEDTGEIDMGAADELLLPDDEKSAGKKTPDSGLQRWAATLLDPCENVGAGRFGGAARLKGGKAALVTPPYGDIKGGGAATIECWVRRETKEKSVLMSCDGILEGTSPIRLRVLSDGRLELDCAGSRMGKTAAALPVNEWAHVAMTVAPDRTVAQDYENVRLPAEIAVRIDSRPAGTFKGEAVAAALRRLGGVVRIGGSAAGDAGFAGLIDEVRISKEVRIFYERDDAWTDPAARRKLVSAPPYLRDEKDCLFAATFDGTVDPARAADNTAVSQQYTPKVETKSRSIPDPAYAPGVRGRAVVVGAGRAMPRYTAPGNVNAERGSFELWFSPFDWDNRKVQGFHDPMEYVPLFRVTRGPAGQTGAGNDLLTFRILHKKPLKGPPPPPIHPGKWYHVVGTWDRGRTRVYLNGRPCPASVASFSVAKDAAGARVEDLFLDPIRTKVNYNEETTLVDELRIYRRPLTAEEVANACRRYRPDGHLAPLPFAHVDLAMNHPLRTVRVETELLSPKRDQVARIAVRVYGPEADKPIGTGEMTEITDGRAELKLHPAAVSYGKHRAEMTFLDKSGGQVERMKIEQDRVRPPWLASPVGIHEGEVLPGWTPMRADRNVVRLWGREITIGPGGLPERIVSQKQDLLSSAMRVAAASGGKQIALRPVGDAPKIEKSNDAVVVTSGSLSGGGLEVRTRITTEFDGLMKVEMDLSGGEVELDSLTVEIPFRAGNAKLMGYWTGMRNFRGATWFGLTPKQEGVVFDSTKPGRGRSKEIRGSFIPYLFLGDDIRGMAWFAENDKGWTQSDAKPAVQVVRAGETVTLKLNILTAPTRLAEPRRIVFGLHPVPVKPLPKDHRSRAMCMNFGYVDGFSKQSLKSDSGGEFDIFPEDYDWDAARKRMERHQRFYEGGHGYTQPILYIDRNWVGLPADAAEHRGTWYRSGFYRYLPEAQNCVVWNMDQWLRRKLICGIYIDDVWLGHCRDPETGPAYRMADGKIQVGFEWFDFREYLKRLRWVFHDNGVKPLIWIHMTRTHFIPTLSFADFMLDGEDRFQGWGSSRDFLDCWPLPDLRFNSGRKWGIIPLWMNKVGADQPQKVPMPHWEYRQYRSYYAGLFLHDIGNAHGWRKDALEAGVYADNAEFIGYWDPGSPVQVAAAEQPAAKSAPAAPALPPGIVKDAPKPAFLASVYRQPARAAIVVVNTGKVPGVAVVRIDPARLFAEGVRLADLAIRDCDAYDPPKGEDITRMARPDGPDAAGGDLDDLDKMFAEALEDVERRELEKKGVFVFDDHNFQWTDGLLRLRVRPHDYRLLVVKKK